MKYIYISLISALLITSCDLSLQGPIEFDPATPQFVDFKNQTMLEWLETKRTPAGALADGEKFDSLLRAISLTGLEAEFNGADPKRTYLLLNNTAWVGTTAGKILRDIGNVRDMKAIPVAKLRALLQYHIITDYVHQIETTKDFRNFYYFQTLIPGEQGRISVKRNELYTLTINNGPQIPEATRKSTGVQRHNYQMKNGIAHILNTYVRYVAF